MPSVSPRVPDRFAYVEEPGRDSNGKSIVDKTDPIHYRDVMEMRHREKWVRVAQAKIVAEQVEECYMRNGVNHIQVCRPLVEQYFMIINDPTFGVRKE